MSSFDDMPVGGGGGKQPPEFASSDGNELDSLNFVAKKPVRPPPARFAKAAAAVVDAADSVAAKPDDDVLVVEVKKPARAPPARFARPTAAAAAAPAEDDCIVVAAPKPRKPAMEVAPPIEETPADDMPAPQRITNSPPLKGIKKADPWDDPSAYPDGQVPAPAPAPARKAVRAAVKSEPSESLADDSMMAPPVSKPRMMSSPPLKGSTAAAPPDMEAASEFAAEAAPPAPLTSGNAEMFGVSAMDDGSAAAGQADLQKKFESMSLEDALGSKVFGIRTLAYQDLCTKFNEAPSTSEPIFTAHSKCFKAIVAESNPQTLDKGLDCFLAFCDKADPNQVLEVAVDVVKDLCAKGLVSKKAEKITQLACAFYDAVEKPDDITTPLIAAALGSKVAKVAGGAVNCVLQAFRTYGPTVVSPKLLLKSLGPLLNHTVPDVRKNTLDLCKEMFRFLGKRVQDMIAENESVRDAQKKELDTMFAAMAGDAAAEPLKLTRTGRAAAAAGGGKAAGPKAGKKGASVLDLMVDPVDVCAQLPKDWLRSMEETDKEKALKWKERVDKIDELLKLCAANPKHIVSGLTSDVTKLMRKGLADSNAAVVTKCVECIVALARGGGREFGREARVCLPPLLSLLREKKAPIERQIHAALDAFVSGCTDLDTVVADIQVALANQVGKVRADTLTWLLRYLDTAPSAEVETTIRRCGVELMVVVFKQWEDKEKEVRDAVLEVCGRIMGHDGGCNGRHSATFAKMDGLDKKRAARVRSVAERIASGGSGSGDATDDKAEAPVAKKPALSSTLPSASTSSAAASAAPAAVARKPVAAASTAASSVAAAPAAKKGAAAAGEKDDEVPAGQCMSIEDARATLASVSLDPAILTGLENKAWAAACEALASLTQWVDSVAAAELDSCTEALMVFLSVAPGWRHSIAKVNQSTYSVVGRIAERSSTFTRRLFWLCFPAMLDKIADTKGAVEIAWTSMASACGPRFAINMVHSAIKNHSSKAGAPINSVAAAYTWVATAVADFTLSGCGSLALIELVKQEWLEHPKPNVKQAAMSVLIAIFKQTGDKLRSAIIEGAKNPKPIEEALAKVAPEEIRCDVGATKSIKYQNIGLLPPPSVDDLLPRVDISRQLDASIKQLGDENWRTKKEGLDAVADCLKRANHRVSGNVGELMPALKGCIINNNKALVLAALGLVGTLAADLGATGMKTQARHLWEPLLSNAANNDKAIRAAAMVALHAVTDRVGLQAVVPQLAKPLANPAARAEILDFMLKYLTSAATVDVPAPASGYELMDLLKPLVSCLIDKTAELRSKAEQCVEYVCTHQGAAVAQQTLRDEVNLLPKANQLQLAPILERLGGGAKVASSAVPSAPAAAAASAIAKPSGLKRPGTAPAAAAAPAPAPKKVDKNSFDDDDCVLRPSDKEARLRREFRRYKAGNSFEDPRPDEIESAHEVLQSHSGAKLYSRLTSADFAENGLALDYLAARIPEMGEHEPAAVLSNLDVLIRTLVGRACTPNCNPSVLLKLLTVIDALLLVCESNSYSLHDLEADALVPALVEKTLGHNNKQIGTRASEICVQRLSHSVAPVKLVSYYLDAAQKSKNGKVNAAALSEIENLIKATSFEAAFPAPSRALSRVAKCVASADAGVRGVALSVLATAFTQLGEQALWRAVGNDEVDAKTRTLIEERLKRTKVPIPAAAGAAAPASANLSATMPRPSTASSALPKPSLSATTAIGSKLPVKSGLMRPGQFGLAVQGDDVPAAAIIRPSTGPSSVAQTVSPQKSIGPSASARSLAVAQSMAMDWSSSNETAHSSASIAEVPPMPTFTGANRHLKIATFRANTLHFEHSAHDILDALSELTLALEAGGTDSSAACDFSSDTDLPCAILAAARKQMNDAFTASSVRHDIVGASIALVLALFERRTHACYITFSSLEPTLEDLLTRFTDARLKRDAHGKALINQINTVLVRVLENSDRENVIVCLLGFICRSAGPAGEPSGAYGWKFHEYSLRCLLKMIKMVRDIELSNVQHVLEEAARFVDKHTYDEYAPHCAQSIQNPYAVVRTLVQEVTKYHLDEALDFASTRSAHYITSAIVDIIRTTASQLSTKPVEAPLPVVAAPIVNNDASLGAVSEAEVMVRTDALIKAIGETDDVTALLQAAQALGKMHSESTAASYIDESILTLAPSKLSIVRRAFGICSVADSVAQHSLPSRRTAVQAEMLQINEVDHKVTAEQRIRNCMADVETLSKGVSELQTMIEAASSAALQKHSSPQKPEISNKENVSSARKSVLRPPRKSLDTEGNLAEVVAPRSPPAVAPKPAAAEPVAAAPTDGASSTMSRLQMLKSRYQAIKAPAK